MTKNLRDSIPSTPNPLPDLEIVSASPEDADRLFEIQRDYELEEVFLDPSHFSDTICRTLLRNTLRKQIVFVAECGGRPVAKAGTNARGYQVDQIGGVFTDKNFRSRGVGTHLMCVLLRYLKAEKSMASLYVKKDNPAASRLYQKLEFRPREAYRISYYYR
jgi:predicted GNAT family acetyltransferase